MKDDDNSHAYWKATIGLLTRILIIWFAVSFGAGVTSRIEIVSETHPI